MIGARAGAALAAVLLLAGCTGTTGTDAAAGAPSVTPTQDSSSPASGTGGQPGRRYVALGDSYTAAPFVPVTDLAGGCLRSDGNYPQLLAAQLGVAVTDVSCSGATTADLTTRQVVGGGRGTVPPQLRAVRRGSDVVSVGIGGNDGDLFERLASVCIGPDQRPLTRCRALRPALTDATAVVGATGRRVAEALRAVQRAAPRADVVLVGYPRLADPARSCPRLPLSAADRTAAARLEQRLDDALRGAASAAGVLFADVHAASRGHEVCSADPWINGSTTDPGAALAFHPFAAEQQAVADTVAELVDSADTEAPG